MKFYITLAHNKSTTPVAIPLRSIASVSLVVRVIFLLMMKTTTVVTILIPPLKYL